VKYGETHSVTEGFMKEVELCVARLHPA